MASAYHITTHPILSLLGWLSLLPVAAEQQFALYFIALYGFVFI